MLTPWKALALRAGKRSSRLSSAVWFRRITQLLYCGGVMHLPKSVQLKAIDAAKPPPEKLKGQFDVVYVRLLQSVIMNDDPRWASSTYMKLLRPGV